MSDKMNNLKIKPDGKTKKLAYLTWLAEQANVAFSKRKSCEWSINALRKTWEEENGQSVYL